MDMSNSIQAAAAAVVKTPEADTETPTRIHPSKPAPLSNGVLKRHAPLHLHHGSFSNHHPVVVVVYKECLKNHAASLGGHAVDGCGEFMPSTTSNPAEPTSLKCAACGCHRNFHRREPDDLPLTPQNATPTLEYQPHHRHQPLPPIQDNRRNSSSSPNNSPSPPPISSSYYPSAPHMLLALSHGLSGPPTEGNSPIPLSINTSSSPNGGRKRFRTKFSQDQKVKMLEFAEKLAWKMQKRDEDLISDFCSEIGVDRGVFKVWMHNNKNSFGKKDDNSAGADHKKPTSPNNDTVVGGGGSVNNAAVDHHHLNPHLHENNDDIKQYRIQERDLGRLHLHNNIFGSNGPPSMSS